MANINKNPTKLAQRRMAAGLTRKQLAEMVDIKDRTIERWEQRRSYIGDISASKLYAVSKVLKCSMEDLMDEAPESK